MLQAICAYITSLCLTNYLKRCLSFTNVQITETNFREKAGFVNKTVSRTQNCDLLFVFVFYRTVLEQNLNEIVCMKAEVVAGGRTEDEHNCTVSSYMIGIVEGMLVGG